MSLYSTLMREVEIPTYGATLTNIVSLKQRGKEMETKKLVVVLNGDLIVDAAECDSVNISFDGNTIKVDVLTTSKEPLKEVPAETGFTVEETVQIFPLQGLDMENFEKLSVFRNKDNKSTKLTGEALTVTTKVFDIQDMNAVDDSISELLQLEKDHLVKGEKVIKVNVVEYIYSDSDHFILAETVILENSEGTPEE